MWVANPTGSSVAKLSGVRTNTSAPGLRTGDPILPTSGCIDGLQIITDVEVDPAGGVWVANNWSRQDHSFTETPDKPTPPDSAARVPWSSSA